MFDDEFENNIVPPLGHDQYACADCGLTYEGPAYYTAGDAGELCPDCTGPFIVPDDPDDPRYFTTFGYSRTEA
jgi:hypothetical protein